MELIKPSQNSEKLTVRHPQRPFERIPITKSCPECGSVFVTKKECEECGFQFWVDQLGEPFSYRSFFQIKEDYLNSLNWFDSRKPLEFRIPLKSHEKYLRQMKNRFDILVGYFFEEIEPDRQKRKMFLFEAKELIWEFVFSGGEATYLWKKIENFDKHPLFQPLADIIQRAEAEREHTLSFWERVGNYRLFNSIRLKVFLALTLGSASVLVASILFYKYLVLSF